MSEPVAGSTDPYGLTLDRVYSGYEAGAASDGTGLKTPAISRREGVERWPLSFAQERLWFLDQLEPRNPSYNIPAYLQLSGDLDVAALRQSLEILVRRHDQLRASFPSEGGVPWQHIPSSLEWEMLALDLTGQSAARQEELVRDYARAEVRAPFDLSRPPLWRVVLLRLGPVRHVLLATFHHIITDGWSLRVFFDELAAVYRACLIGTPAVLPRQPIRYVDFAAWQREWLRSPALQVQLEYWRKQLAGYSGVLDLPTDRSRPLRKTYQGGHVPLAMSTELTLRLLRLAREARCTIFMTLLAAFLVLLSRYAGKTDLAVGTPIAGRRWLETEGLLGLFVNSLVLRVDLGGRPTFRDLLARVRQVALDAYHHQDLPFEKLVEGLGVERDLSRSPFFQVLFSFQNLPLSALHLPGLELAPLEFESGTAKFDLTLFLDQTPQGLQGHLEYDGDLWERETISRLARHFDAVLAGAVDTPDTPVTRLPLVTPDERRRLLVDLNPVPQPQWPTACVHELFRVHAAGTPDRVAIVYRDEHLTYARLDERSNQLSHLLRRQGVGTEVTVGIALQPSPPMVEALLAVLKAGGAYVPLDARHPPERLAAMCRAARVAVIVTSQDLRPHIFGQTPVICVDADWPKVVQEAKDAPPDRSDARQVAYVLYTSGSTGQPKGVAVEHRQLVSYADAIVERAGLIPGMTYAMVQPLTVDSSVTMIWPSLLTGGCLHLVNRDDVVDRETMVCFFEERMIDCLKIAPSHLAALPGVMPRKRLIVGGESSSLSWLKGLQAASPQCLILNHYGPTETTVGVLTYRLSSDAPDRAATPLGQPLAHTQVYILDDEVEPMPLGVPGEIYVGGESVARGYFDQPALTAEYFLPDPFSTIRGRRLYPTGDLGRYLLNGTIEFLGRRDDQVKIRGFRVDPAEIESVLVQHPAVGRGIVLARDRGGELNLVAYVVPRGPGPLNPDALRDFLSERLPDYMLPVAIVTLDEFPRTPHGKVDRARLPVPSRSAQSTTMTPPRTLQEELMARLWADVLQVPRVGIHEDFFALGGHSLLATRLVSRVREVFGVDVPIRALFEEPTLERFMLRIDGLKRGEVIVASLPPLVPVLRDAPFALSFAQQRMWLLNQFEPNLPLYNVSTAFHLRGPLSLEGLAYALNRVVARHEVLRTTFQMRDGEPVQVVAPEMPIPLREVDFSSGADDPETAALNWVNEEARLPFDLERGPLLRPVIARLGADDHLLAICVHHIVFDRWSRAIFMQELATFYREFVTGRAAAFQPLPVQYADFAVWQRRWLTGPVLEAQLAYWKRQLRGAASTVRLQTDRPRPAVLTFQGNVFLFTVPPDVYESLKALSRAENATLYMTLLACFQILLYRYSGQTDFCVGSPIANRTRPELEPLIGFFANTLVFRADLTGNPTFRDLLARVRQVALDAYVYQDLPFERLVEELHPNRYGGQSPFFTVMFTFQNVPLRSRLDLSDVNVSEVFLDEGIAKRDLTLRMEEADGRLWGMFEYSTDLFDPPTIERMAARFTTLLMDVSAVPDTRIQDLDLLTPSEREERRMEAENRAASARAKFEKALGRKPVGVSLAASEVVRTGFAREEGSLPLIIEARYDDVDLIGWTRENHAFVEDSLRRSGGILFRGFRLQGPGSLEAFALVLTPHLMNYTERSTPRHEVEGKVYTSTEYPADQYIMLHNEMSYAHDWPMKIWFLCARPAERGGETPIADSRKVLEMLDPRLKALFMEKGVMYIRNYGEGLDLPWHTVFQTTDRAEVEAYCRRAGIEFEWKPGDRLRTRQVRQAVARHPHTGHLVWFNAAHMFHVTGLEPAVRESLLRLFGEEDLPRSAYYGDGSPIEASVMEEIRETYRRVTVSFPWQQGDVMLLDNMLAAHGRTPYLGPRQVLVVMGEPFSGVAGRQAPLPLSALSGEENAESEGWIGAL